MNHITNTVFSNLMLFTSKSVKKIEHGGSQSFVRRAIELGITVELLLESPRVLKLSYKGRVVFAVGSDIPLVRSTGRTTTANKVVTKAILASENITVPRGVVAHSYTEAKREVVAEHLLFPLISKPIDSSLAYGVTWNIQTFSELKKGIKFIESLGNTRKRKAAFLVEEMARGDEYRVLVLDNQVLSCVKKTPATVTGDGKSSIIQLIKVFNKTRKRGFEIKVDAIVRKTLQRRGFSLESILPSRTELRLRYNLNMSDGGRSVEFTEKMSPALKKICVKAISVLGLHYGGIDLITPSLKNAKGYSILEINDRPYFNMNEKPLVEGRGVDVAGLLLKKIFPRFPLSKISSKRD